MDGFYSSPLFGFSFSKLYLYTQIRGCKVIAQMKVHYQTTVIHNFITRPVLILYYLDYLMFFLEQVYNLRCITVNCRVPIFITQQNMCIVHNL